MRAIRQGVRQSPRRSQNVRIYVLSKESDICVGVVRHKVVIWSGCPFAREDIERAEEAIGRG